jgi:hypothetical protein
MRGGHGYFGFCGTPEVLLSLTRRVRLRLRAAKWRQWKTLVSRKGQSPSVVLSDACFKSPGLPSLVDE